MIASGLAQCGLAWAFPKKLTFKPSLIEASAQVKANVKANAKDANAKGGAKA